MPAGNILVIGAAGQIGIELVLALRERFGTSRVIASDIRTPEDVEVAEGGPFVNLNILNEQLLLDTVKKHNISTVYHLAAMLSASAEKHPDKAWDLNMSSLFNVLDLAREGIIKKIFWPSSIAVFGPSTPKLSTPQFTVCDPTTVYGISKLAGERWCEYYFNKYQVDVRSLRYPGLIGHRSSPGGGTTDYAVDIFYKAIAHSQYTSFLAENRSLPMMYMEDAIRATIDITEASPENISIRSSYNLSGLSFSPKELALQLKQHIPDFEISYETDFRDQIAESWPDSIDDTLARSDWGWRAEYDLAKLVSTMHEAIQKKNKPEVTL
jgi:nucleoside-diphosphate-sugar epimerase